MKIVRRMSGRMFRISGRQFLQFRYSEYQEMGQNSKKYVWEDVQWAGKIVQAVQVLSAAGGG